MDVCASSEGACLRSRAEALLLAAASALLLALYARGQLGYTLAFLRKWLP